MMSALIACGSEAPNAHDAAQAPTDGKQAEDVRAKWTVLVYMAADNNLEQAAMEDLSEMLDVADSADVHVIVQVDRTVGLYDLGIAGIANWTSMKRFRVAGGKLEELEDLGELDTGATETLSDFLAWGFRTYPAARQAIVLWNHGNAWRGYGNDDTSDKDQLDLREIGEGIAEGLSNAGLSKIDLIGFDACMMSSPTTAELVEPFAHYLVASEELAPDSGWDYTTSFKYLVDHPDADAQSFGVSIVEAYFEQARAVRKHRDVTSSLLDLSRWTDVDAALSSLLDTAEANLEASTRDIADAQLHAVEYGHHADPAMAYHLRDLGDFTRLLAEHAPLYASARSRLQQALEELVIHEHHGPNKLGSTGLSLYFPPQHAYYDAQYDALSQGARWRRFIQRYYTLAMTSQAEPPAFQDMYMDKPVGGAELPAAATSDCDPSEGPSIVAHLSGDDAQQVANASLIAGFIEVATGRPCVFTREQAVIDQQTHKVIGTWDRHLLVAEQGSQTIPLFAEVSLDATGRYANAEVPLLYSMPVECPCALLGTPGYSDVDDDKMPDCADEDVDADGVADKSTQPGPVDNCPWRPNPRQEDTNGDGVGDACEASSGAPSLSCTPMPSGDFGTKIPAVWRVVVDRFEREAEVDTLYLLDPAGSAELTPEAGSVLWPRRLVVRPDGTSELVTDPPLQLNLRDRVRFDYADSELLYVHNAAGDPLLKNGQPMSLMRWLGFGPVYLHLELDDFTGRGDVAIARADTTCDVPGYDACPDDTEPDCTGRCIDAWLVRPNGVCDDGSNGGLDRFCERFNYDDGECARPSCSGGYVRDCNGQCTLLPELIGNGQCDALAACRALDWDGGDCSCGPACSNHGACGTSGCSCRDGYTGTFCEQPPSCGDGMCSADSGESCLTCTLDCGACPEPCGDGVCKRGDAESCASCPQDCGECKCGDGVCLEGAEDCVSCSADCGSCPTCGDFACARWTAGAGLPSSMQEHCANCPTDCGSCYGDCCTATGERDEASSQLGCGETAIASCVCAADPACCNTQWTAACIERAQRDCGLRCDDCSDADGADVDSDVACGSRDNCPTVSNANQADGDGDGIGDACDRCAGNDALDSDGDNIPDDCDPCPLHSDHVGSDEDGDGIDDACDPCPSVPNANRDPRACADGDLDDVLDVIDSCLELDNPAQLDSDGDGWGDACDNCVDVANTDQLNSSGDARGDACTCPDSPEACVIEECEAQAGGDCSCLAETCNGIDDDCDGLVDDGCPACTPRLEICGDGIDQDCDGVPDDGCTCVAGPERCANAIDDDCDRVIDEADCEPL